MLVIDLLALRRTVGKKVASLPRERVGSDDLVMRCARRKWGREGRREDRNRIRGFLEPDGSREETPHLLLLLFVCMVTEVVAMTSALINVFSLRWPYLGTYLKNPLARMGHRPLSLPRDLFALPEHTHRHRVAQLAVQHIAEDTASRRLVTYTNSLHSSASL